MNSTLNQAQEPNPFEQSFSLVTAPSKKLNNNPPQMLAGVGNNSNVDVWVSDTSTYTFDSNSINNDSYSVSDHQVSSNSTSEDSRSNSDDILLNNNHHNNSNMYEFEQQRPKRHNNVINYIDSQQAAQQYQYQAQFINNTSSNPKNGGKKQSATKQNKKGARTVKLPEDEEKRKNFLERNCLAALKCRQRKKQWLSNLQARVKYLTNDNEQLQMESEALRKEIMDLKTLLVAHKDCPQYNAAAAAATAAGQSMYQHHHQLQQPFYHQSSDFNNHNNTAASILQ